MFIMFLRIAFLLFSESRNCQNYWNILQSLSRVCKVSTHKILLTKYTNFHAVPIGSFRFPSTPLFPVHKMSMLLFSLDKQLNGKFISKCVVISLEMTVNVYP